MKYLAYSKLYQIATDQSPRGLADRSAPFGDTKHLPSLWSKFVRESLVLLGQDYQIVLGRGRAPAPTSPPAPAPSTPSTSQIPGTPTHLIKKSIYKTDPNTTAGNNTLAADAIRIRDSLQSSLLQTGFLWKLWSGAVGWLHAQIYALGNRLYVRFVPVLVREAIGDFTKWWRRERVHKTVEACFPRKEIDKLAIRGLVVLCYFLRCFPC
jgi:nucleoporin NDC1